MSLRLSNEFVNTNVAGSYFINSVKTNPVGVAVSGNIAIIGEASGGADFSAEDLKENFYSPDQISQVTNKYISGPIVDAFRALSAPSSDGNITGSASRIYILKTNTSTKAESTVPTSYGTLSDKNYGVDGNKYFYQVTQIEDEVGAAHSGATISNFAALAGAKFAVRFKGGASTVIDVFTGLVGTFDTIAEVVALIDAALPVGLEAVLGTASNSVKIQTETDASANLKGEGKSFEVIETDAGDLAAIGLTEGLYISSQEPIIQLDIKRTDSNTNESFAIEAMVALSIGYEGTTATLTSNGTTLSTTVTGGTGANLSITLSNYTTIKDLADFINAQTGYSCSVANSSGQLSPSALDQVSAIGICSTAADLEPGRVKKALYIFKQKAAQSAVLDFTATATKGLPTEMLVPSYLTGGDKGSTLAADVISAIDALEAINVNFIVPLFSRDASEDITDGLTESSSTYTIAATNAAVKTHVLKMSSAKIKKHRQAFLSYWSSYSAIKAEAASLSNYRISFVFQKTSQTDNQGVVRSFFPWHTACIAAGMQAAGFYKSILNKFANVISFTDPSGFDSGSFGDQEDAIDSGLLFLQKNVSGNKWLNDQTTYGLDTNFVYNSIQAVYAADLVSLDLAQSFQDTFVGQSLADVNATLALSFLDSKMAAYRVNKLIAASDDAPAGYKNAKITISGPVMSVSVEIKLSTSLYFVSISIDISEIQSSASA